MSLCTVFKVVQNAKWKIRCVAQYHNLIIAGCNDQCIRVFAPFQRTKSKQSIEYECIQIEKLSGKQITQMEVVEYVDLLIVIIDENVSFYSLYTPRELGSPFLDDSKISFSINKLFDMDDDDGRGTVILTCSKAWSDGIKKKLFIAIGKRKEILVFQWKGSVASNLQHCKQRDVLKRFNAYPVPDKPRLLILAGKAIFVGFREQYDRIHLENSEKHKIFSTGKRLKDAVGIRLTNRELLLVVDKTGYFLNYDAKPTRSSCIEWSDIPLSLAYFHPYVVAVTNRGIEVHHVQTAHAVQQIEFKTGKFTASVCYRQADIWSVFLCVASSYEIVAVAQSLISEQLKYLKEHALYEEALKTISCYATTQFDAEGLDQELKTRWINEYYAYDLFNHSEWKQAVEKFLESGISARRVISLFPTLVPVAQCKRARTKHPVSYQNVKTLDSTFKAAVTQFLIPYLSSIRQQMETVAAEHDPHKFPVAYEQHLQLVLSPFDDPSECESQQQQQNEWSLAQLVDTVYCKCLIEMENSEALRVFLQNKHNQCNVQECDLLLRRSKRFEELVLLYQAHGQHKAALDLMKVKNAQINGLNKTIKYLQKLGEDAKYEKLVLHFSEWVFKEDANEALRIFTGKPFEYHHHHDRQQQSHKQQELQLALQLPKIPPLKVMDHLERIKTPIPTRIDYLELLIFEGGEQQSIFHDELIKLYLQEIFNAIHEQQKEDQASLEKYGLAAGDIVELTAEYSLGKWGTAKAGTEARVSKVVPTPNQSNQVYVTFPETGTLGVVPQTKLKKIEKKLRVTPEKQEGRVGDLRRKLIRFLQTSTQFIPTNVKRYFPTKMLLEEQAWLRAQIPAHREALHIIVYDLDDASMASAYCKHIYAQFEAKRNDLKRSLMVRAATSSIDINRIESLALESLLKDSKWIEAQKIYLTLLDVYLNPLAEYEHQRGVFVQHALALLRDNHDKVDAIAVFEKLPDSMVVRECVSYLEAVFKSGCERKRQFQIRKNLLKQASLKVKLNRILKEQSFQEITDETKCAKCNKRIGHSAFVRYPDQKVFHYVCFQPMHGLHHSPALSTPYMNKASILHEMENDRAHDSDLDLDDDDTTLDID